ncbi:hypothetical protein PENTCL1PPCAC_27874, partial [Pristionchus entomophagus]
FRVTMYSKGTRSHSGRQQTTRERDYEEDQPSSSNNGESTGEGDVKSQKDNESEQGSSTEKIPRTRRRFTNAMRAKRVAETKKNEVITQAKETNYLNPPSAAGIRAFQDLRRKELEPQRIVFPPLRGRNAAPNHCSTVKKATSRYSPPQVLLRPKDKSSIESNGIPSGTIQDQIIHDAGEGASSHYDTRASPTAPMPLPRDPNAVGNQQSAACPNSTIKLEEDLYSMVKIEEEEDGDATVLKIEEEDSYETSSGSAKFLSFDVSGDGVHERSVKMEIEEPIEAPDTQPFTPFTPILRSTRQRDEDRVRRLKERHVELRNKTVGYWESTVQNTLRNCTEAIKTTVSQGQNAQYIHEDMIFVMAEFLKPALMRLDQIEQQKDETILHDMKSQFKLDEASAKLMERVSRQEAGRYDAEHLPIVKFARAFATFADRFSKLTVEMIKFADLADPPDDEAFRNYEEEMLHLSTASMPKVYRISDDRKLTLAENKNASRSKEMEVEESIWDDIGQGIEPGVKRRKVEIRHLTAKERLEEYDGDSSALNRTKVKPTEMRREKITRSAGMGTKIVLQTVPLKKACLYCDVNAASEAHLIDHVKRVHFDQWKNFAPFSCKWKPHCDFRTIKRWYMDQHTSECHNDQYRKWIVGERMKLEASECCPFCDRSVYNVHLFHDHLEDRHEKDLRTAVAKNHPFIGCGSCSFSAFWACDVYKHWRDKSACTGKLVLRKMPRIPALRQIEEVAQNAAPNPVPARTIIKLVRPATIPPGATYHAPVPSTRRGARMNPVGAIIMPPRDRVIPEQMRPRFVSSDANWMSVPSQSNGYRSVERQLQAHPPGSRIITVFPPRARNLREFTGGASTSNGFRTHSEHSDLFSCVTHEDKIKEEEDIC